MAYQLQPHLKIVENPAVPSVCATEEFIAYPQPSVLNYASSRPNTMLYGTAPYMAGKGAPKEFIDVSDELRPQSTSGFNKFLVKTYERNFFPLQDVQCKIPLRTNCDPSSTRAILQNNLFEKRYFNKNINMK